MDNPETLATIGYTRHRTKTNKTKTQHNTENLKTFQATTTKSIQYYTAIGWV
jgi:hypothetical protein